MTFRTSRWLLVGGMLLSVAGCYAKGDPDVEPRTSACTPLASADAPVELGIVIGVGQGSDGIVYLMDRVESSLRIFVSSGDELFRARVSGAGQLSDEGVETNLATFEYGGADFTMGVELQDGTARVAIGPGGERSFEAIIEGGEELTVVPDTILDDYVLRNLPGDLEVEYLASVETGERLAVIRPTNDWTYDDFRLFIGEPEHLIERQVTSVVRTRDGGSTWIRFDFHGEAAEVSFPVADPATLTTGSGTFAVEPLPLESVTSFSFECLEH